MEKIGASTRKPQDCIFFHFTFSFFHFPFFICDVYFNGLGPFCVGLTGIILPSLSKVISSIQT